MTSNKKINKIADSVTQQVYLFLENPEKNAQAIDTIEKKLNKLSKKEQQEVLHTVFIDESVWSLTEPGTFLDKKVKMWDKKYEAPIYTLVSKFGDKMNNEDRTDLAFELCYHHAVHSLVDYTNSIQKLYEQGVSFQPCMYKKMISRSVSGAICTFNDAEFDKQEKLLRFLLNDPKRPDLNTIKYDNGDNLLMDWLKEYFPHLHRNPLPVVKLLVQHGIDVNAQNNEGQTALHRLEYNYYDTNSAFVQTKHVMWQNQIRRYLLRFADPTIEDDKGNRPYAYATWILSNGDAYEAYSRYCKPLYYTDKAGWKKLEDLEKKLILPAKRVKHTHKNLQKATNNSQQQQIGNE